jgi:hypothetical protein
MKGGRVEGWKGGRKGRRVEGRKGGKVEGKKGGREDRTKGGGKEGRSNTIKRLKVSFLVSIDKEGDDLLDPLEASHHHQLSFHVPTRK